MRKSNGDGVSPIIATILMLVLTVLLVSIVSVPLISSSVDSLNDSVMLIDKIIQKPTPMPIETPSVPEESGSDNAIKALVDSINASYPGTVKYLDSEKGFELLKDLVIADYSISITNEMMSIADPQFTIKASGYSIKRGVSDSNLPLLVFESTGTLHVISGELTLDGANLVSGAPLLEIKSGVNLNINGDLTLKNNINQDGSMPGGGLCNRGTVVLDGKITISDNTAPKGGGIYNTGDLELNSNWLNIRENTATEMGGGIYNAGGSVTLTKIGGISANSAPAGNGMSYYAVNGSTTSGISGLITTSTGDKYRDTDI